MAIDTSQNGIKTPFGFVPVDEWVAVDPLLGFQVLTRISVGYPPGTLALFKFPAVPDDEALQHFKTSLQGTQALFPLRVTKIAVSCKEGQGEICFQFPALSGIAKELKVCAVAMSVFFPDWEVALDEKQYTCTLTLTKTTQEEIDQGLTALGQRAYPSLVKPEGEPWQIGPYALPEVLSRECRIKETGGEENLNPGGLPHWQTMDLAAWQAALQPAQREPVTETASNSS